MKRLLTLVLVSCSLLATGQKKFTVNKEVITYTTSTSVEHTFTYSTGVVLKRTGSAGNVAVIAAYKEYLAALPKPAAPVVVPPVEITPPASTFKEVGTGSGDLRLGTISNVKLKIKPGTYTGISVDKATNVVIDGTDVKIPGGQFNIANATNLEAYGMVISDQPQARAINIRGFCNGINIHHMSFKNIHQTVIGYEWKVKWDGKEESKSKNFSITYCTFENTANCFGTAGGFDYDGVTSLMSGFTFSYNSIKDCGDMGAAVWSGAMEKYEIAYNVIDHVNYNYPDPKYPNGYHNGVISITGNGSFHHNKLTNHQGNFCRAWGVTFGGPKATIEIYDNVVWNSKKYSAFETQVPPHVRSYVENNPEVGYSYTNTKIYNNTAGRMGWSLDWDGQMIDQYGIDGDYVYKNNLGFEMTRTDGDKVIPLELGRNMANMADAPQKDGNRYFHTAPEAVIDLISFKSKVAGVGARL